MKKTLTDILWEEVKNWFEFRCIGVPENRKNELWVYYKKIINSRVEGEYEAMDTKQIPEHN
jgi:hypothetical protein